MSGYATINGASKELTAGFATIGGAWKTISKGWVTKNGVWKQILSSGLPLSSLPEGALVAINESGSPVLFYLAKHDYESGLNGAGRTLFVRKDCYDKRKWNSKLENAYASSTIDSWLNGDYKALLDQKVQSEIGTTVFYYTPSQKDNDVTTLERSIFMLSTTELGKQGGDANAEGLALPIANTLQILPVSSLSASQWTRSPSKGNYAKVFVITYSSFGTVSASMTDCSSEKLSRPCFTLPSTATVNPQPNADGSYTLTI